MAFTRTFLIALAAFIALEGLIFRSSFYPRFLEPTSSTGQFEGALRDEMKRRRLGPDEVLVTGDSRMGEGFSAKLANAASIDHKYYFANIAVAGSTPRAIYYLLRDLDPSRNRYRAIILPMDSYGDIDGFEDLADRLLDLHYCVVRLRYSDVFEFGFSFTTPRRRMEALRGSLFKGLVFQPDILALFEHRRKRLEEVAAWREHGWEWQNDYEGHEETMEGIQVNWAGKSIQFPDRISASNREIITQALFGPIPPQTGGLARYRRLWLGRIFDLYRNSNTKLIFMALPRGPVVPPIQRVQPRSYTVRDMGNAHGAILLPENQFAFMEEGSFYFDTLHFNKTGRKEFSPLLAQWVRSTLGPSRN